MEKKRMGKKRLRENAFKYVFSLGFGKKTEEEKENFFIENNFENEEDKQYLLDIDCIFNQNISNIDDLIQRNMKSWALNRLHKVTLALLRLAVLEIQYFDVPFKLTINEVVELSKKYSDEKNTTFINGVLAGVVKELDKNKE